MLTMTKFAAENGITMTVERIDHNPNMDDMPSGSRHFACTIKHGDLIMLVPFSQGPAYTADPTIADVLDCLASDASTVDNARDFEDWAAELGYDTDSRRAEKAYTACVEQTAELRALLGDALFEACLYETERE